MCVQLWDNQGIMAALQSMPPMALLAEVFFASPICLHFCSGVASSEKGGFSERGCMCVGTQESSNTQGWEWAGAEVTTVLPLEFSLLSLFRLFPIVSCKPPPSMPQSTQ